jgi:RHS repeat-associated protein
MPMSVTYATVNGRMVQENRGGTVTKYVPDTLGSVIQTRDATGVQTSTAHYWPFGEVRTSTGTNPSPWGFVGNYGCLTDAPNRQYVRARYLRNDLSRWTTVDRLWPRGRRYTYAGNQPLGKVDPSGMSEVSTPLPPIVDWIKDLWTDPPVPTGVPNVPKKVHDEAWPAPKEP